MKTLSLCLALVSAAAYATHAAEAGPPRIGILSDAGARKEADLLMIEMQKFQCELVERDEIDKVLGEQAMSLAKFTSKDALRVGGLLKADGLVLLAAHTNDARLVRLVAVAPGVVVWFGESQASSGKRGDSESWQKTIAATLAGYLQKLAVKAGDAIPVSLLRVRPEIGTARAAEVAKDLNRLLQVRLVREPALFVLERENLAQMEEEHRWAGQVSDFWTGSYVMGGTVSHDVTETDRVTFRLVLTCPPIEPMDAGARKRKKEAAIEKHFVETVRHDELPKLVEQIVGKVSAHLGVQNVRKPWDPLGEAEAFVRLADRQVGIEEQKTSLETAMALGLRDWKVGAMYCDVLEAEVSRNRWLEYGMFKERSRVFTCSKEELRQHASRVLTMLAFASSYGQGTFTPEDEQKWFGGAFRIHMNPLRMSASFLELVCHARRENDLGEQLGQIQVEARKLCNRFWFKNEFRAAARRDYYHLSHIRYIYNSAEEILRVFHWFYDPPKTGTECTDGRGRGPETTLQRELIDPVFASATAESGEQRDAMWNAFLEGAGATNNPLNRLKITARPAQVAASEQLKYWMHQWKQTAPNAETKLGWRKAFQDQLWEDRECLVSGQVDAWELLGRAYEKTGPQPQGVSRVDECGRAARMFVFLCDHEKFTNEDIVSKAAPMLLLGSVQEVWPYLAERSVYRSIRNREQRHEGQGADKTGLAFLRKKLEARFPYLEEENAPPIPALAVNDLIEWPYTTWREMKDSSRYYGAKAPYWKDNKLWFHHYGDILGLDPQTRKVEKVGHFDVPGYDGNGDIFVIVTDTFYAFVVDSMTVHFLALRRRTGGEWHSAFFAGVRVEHVVEANGNAYALINRQGPKYSWTAGIVAVDPEAVKFTTVLDPLTMANDKPPESDLRMFQAVKNCYGRVPLLRAAQGELLVECRKNTYYAWNPESRNWRSVDKTLWEKAQEDQNPYRTASHPFEFEVLRDQPSWRAGLAIRNLVAGTKITIPLECKRKCVSSPILTATSVLLRVNERDSPGFLEIPYADIQQWLAVNGPPAASTNVSGVFVPAGTGVQTQAKEVTEIVH